MTNPQVIEEITELKNRMENTLEAFKKELSGLRTSRASISLLDPVVVDMYGSRMPLSQVGTVNAPDAKMLTVQVWDKSAVKAVEKAITEAGLGLNPFAEGQLVRVPLPDLTQERRQELIKVAHKYAEAGRVRIRNVRRDGMEALKEQLKKGVLSEDVHHNFGKDVQELTDTYTQSIDGLLATKEREITQI